MTPKELADMDQGFKTIAESLPPFLWNFYKNLLVEGFREDQAFYLTAEYMRNMGKTSQ